MDACVHANHRTRKGFQPCVYLVHASGEPGIPLLSLHSLTRASFPLVSSSPSGGHAIAETPCFETRALHCGSPHCTYILHFQAH